MAQNSPLRCPQCGTPAEAGQRFCSECGAALNVDANKPTALAADNQATMESARLRDVKDGRTLASAMPAQSPSQPAAAAAGPASVPPTPNMPAAVPGPGVTPVQPPDVSASGYSTVPTSGGQFYVQTTEAHVIPPPPPPESFIAAPQQAPSSPSYPAAAPGSYVVPDYARAPKRSRRGCIAALVLLLVLAAGGVAAFFALRHPAPGGNKQSSNSSSGQQSTPGSSNTPASAGSTPSSSGSTPTSGGPTTEQLNLRVIYSSINMTIVSAQLASSFSDDPSAPQGGVRVNLHEQNPTTSRVLISYSDAVRLVLPDGSITPPANEQHFSPPDPGVSRDNWIDFPVTSSNIDLSKLVLRLGTPAENQVDIPLKPGADLSKYQPKTVSPNSTFQYAGLNWTLVSATESLSAGGKQATAGNVYITVTLKAVNSTADYFSAYPGDYMRMKAGDTTSAPESNFTFPLSIASQATGSGTVSFLVPQGTTSFSLVMLARQTSPPISQVSVPLQIP